MVSKLPYHYACLNTYFRVYPLLISFVNQELLPDNFLSEPAQIVPAKYAISMSNYSASNVVPPAVISMQCIVVDESVKAFWRNLYNM